MGSGGAPRLLLQPTQEGVLQGGRGRVPAPWLAALLPSRGGWGDPGGAIRLRVPRRSAFPPGGVRLPLPAPGCLRSRSRAAGNGHPREHRRRPRVLRFPGGRGRIQDPLGNHEPLRPARAHRCPGPDWRARLPGHREAAGLQTLDSGAPPEATRGGPGSVEGPTAVAEVSRPRRRVGGACPMTDPAHGIEAFFRRRYGREALYLPSGRLALYLAFREWLRPGDRILISPINDDVVFFTVLAAGLVPVLGPLDPATGNLDPSAVNDGTWSGLKAVMTTNLYGIPDRMDLLDDRCRRHGILLIEDACQALDSRLGDRRIGQFSPVAAFSLTKHVDGVGGVLCFSEEGRRIPLAWRADSEIRRRSLGRKVRDE